jgi:hypothetical protein
MGHLPLARSVDMGGSERFWGRRWDRSDEPVSADPVVVVITLTFR